MGMVGWRQWSLAVVAILSVVPAANGQPADVSAQAEQIHLAWDRQEYWVTFLHPLVLNPAATSVPATYTTTDGTVHQAQWFRGPNSASGPQAYHFRMDPDTVQYTIGSRTFEVRPAPAVGEPVRVAFLADIGMTANTSALLELIADSDVDMILMGGDLSYADGDPAVWDAWFRFIEPYASVIPVQPARGNHEGRCLPVGGVNRLDCSADEKVYSYRFFAAEAQMFYGFEWGAARFYSLDTEAHFPRTPIRPDEILHNTDPDEQRAFVDDRLRGNSFAWEIAYFHRPVYSSNGAHGSELGIRDHLAPTLEAGGADLVLSGHDHGYERTWPLRNGIVTEESRSVTKGDGTVYVVSGGGGESLYTTWSPLPDWSAVRSAEFHFLLLNISAERIDVKAIREDGSVLDQFSVERASEPQPSQQSPSVGLLAVIAAVGVLAVFRRR